MDATSTMIAALALLAVPPQPAETSSPDNGDIVVLAHRLKKVRWEFESKNGILLKCEVKRTSGSALVDTLVWKASAQCAAEHPMLRDVELVPYIRDRVVRLYSER